MLKFSPLLLLLSIPFLPATPYYGLPLWAWFSLGMSILYALVLILSIQTEWDEESKDA